MKDRVPKAVFFLFYSPSLKDGATPIFVMDTNDILESLQKASIKDKSVGKENYPTIDGNNNSNPEKEV